VNVVEDGGHNLSLPNTERGPVVDEG
jgi:hypothetical protein